MAQLIAPEVYVICNSSRTTATIKIRNTNSEAVTAAYYYQTTANAASTELASGASFSFTAPISGTQLKIVVMFSSLDGVSTSNGFEKTYNISDISEAKELDAPRLTFPTIGVNDPVRVDVENWNKEKVICRLYYAGSLQTSQTMEIGAAGNSYPGTGSFIIEGTKGEGFDVSARFESISLNLDSSWVNEYWENPNKLNKPVVQFSFLQHWWFR